jgi:NADH-quinone oxidoreductase subunit E
VLDRYPDPKAACIPALHLCQEQNGWIDQQVAEWLADRLGLSAAHVLGVATFYSLFNTAPVGKHQVWVCRPLSCALQGSERLLDHCEKRLGIRCGGTTPDGKITLRSAECLASCGSGPVVQVDKTYHERVTIPALDAILDGLLADEGVEAS